MTVFWILVPYFQVAPSWLLATWLGAPKCDRFWIRALRLEVFGVVLGIVENDQAQ